MNYAQWVDKSQLAMSTWHAANDTLPIDVVGELGTGPQTFEWVWWSQAEIENDVGFVPAYTHNFYGGTTGYANAIAESHIRFAFDVQGETTSGRRVRLYWVADCAPACADSTYDYLNAAVHEYGHALGLDHTMDTEATMYGQMGLNEYKKKTLSPCDVAIIGEIYRDNFGPSVLDSFVVHDLGSDVVECSWSVRQESACGQYRVTKQCEDGLGYIVADSVACVGPGVLQVVLDTDPCPGVTTYTLSVRDSISDGIYQDLALEEQQVDLGGTLGLAPLASDVATDEVPPGFETPEAAVEALGAAISAGDMVSRRRALADGFTYYEVGGLFWGRAIDGILEDASRVCLSASAETLSFVPIATEPIRDGLVLVRAGVSFAYDCPAESTNWAGQVEALVELFPGHEGWRVRQIRELW